MAKYIKHFIGAFKADFASTAYSTDEVGSLFGGAGVVFRPARERHDAILPDRLPEPRA
jgi:hypothetical protein